MGRWVTTSQGRRLYIPDEGEENPYVKQVDKEIAEKDRQIAANKEQADQKNKEDWLTTPSEDKAYKATMDKKIAEKQAKKESENRSRSMLSENNINPKSRHEEVYKYMKSLGLSEEFVKARDRAGMGKTYYAIASSIIAKAIQKGKL